MNYPNGQPSQYGQPYSNQYQPYYPPPKKKGKLWLWIVLGLVAVVVLCGIISSASKSSTNKSTATTGSNQAKEPTKAPTNKHFTVGEPVTVEDTWEIVVSQSRTTQGDNPYSAPKAGNTYLLIDVTLKNVSDKEKELYGTFNWTLKSTDGQEYNTTFFSGADSPPSGKIEAGTPAKGTLAYEVPDTVKAFWLSFQTNAYAKGQTVWDLNL